MEQEAIVCVYVCVCVCVCVCVGLFNTDWSSGDGALKLEKITRVPPTVGWIIQCGSCQSPIWDSSLQQMNREASAKFFYFHFLFIYLFNFLFDFFFSMGRRAPSISSIYIRYVFDFIVGRRSFILPLT